VSDPAARTRRDVPGHAAVGKRQPVRDHVEAGWGRPIAMNSKLTIVAYYDRKPSELTSLILQLQDMVFERLDGNLRRRNIDEVHATIIQVSGPLSECPERPSVWQSFAPLAGELKRRLRAMPLTIRFGGYDPLDHRAMSRGRSLYERSLTVEGRGDLVLIGWPADERDGAPISPALDQMRRGLQTFGVRHKYHDTSSAVDADLHLVIGHLISPRAQNIDPQIENTMIVAREFMRRTPITVPLTDRHLQVIRYIDGALPRESSIAMSLDQLYDAR
jgi:hypothetical protein